LDRREFLDPKVRLASRVHPEFRGRPVSRVPKDHREFPDLKVHLACRGPREFLGRPVSRVPKVHLVSQVRPEFQARLVSLDLKVACRRLGRRALCHRKSSEVRRLAETT
jgi:hypothetical protein